MQSRPVTSYRAIVATALITGTVFAAGPSAAQAAYDALNADKVDGKSAVGAKATAEERARKLVATDKAGRLPNDIIAKAQDSDSLDGLDSTAFLPGDGKAADADKLDGLDSTAFLPGNGKAADAHKLDGLDSSEFAQGEIISESFTAPYDQAEAPGVTIPGLVSLTLYCYTKSTSTPGTWWVQGQDDQDATVFIDNGSADPIVEVVAINKLRALQEGPNGDSITLQIRDDDGQMATLWASAVHRLIAELDFPIIYTTNFDRNLETSLRLHGRDFVKITNAKDVARAREGVTQLVKFHGDFEDDQSLVIAETDYLERLAFSSPLDIKFRADALGKTILFVGYSLSDLNIRLLLYRLWRTWRESGYEKDRPKSFVFMMRPNPVEEAVLEQWGIRALSEDTEDPESALETFLGKLKEQVEAE